jgi:hypothetical protein
MNKPEVQKNIDWSGVISNAQYEVDEIEKGTYHEDNDNAHYIYEAVMQAIYGKDYFKWMNENT